MSPIEVDSADEALRTWQNGPTPQGRQRDLPLRLLRLAKTAVAISLASAPLVAVSMPAFAKSSESAPTAASPKYEWWLRTLSVARSWHSGEGAGITVAVLSDGVEPGESFLAGSVIYGPDFTRTGRTPRSHSYGVMGTSLAGLIAGHGESAFGKGTRDVDGVAPAAKVLSVRVTLSPGDPLWADKSVTRRLPGDIAAGIRYAVTHGATIIDLPADPGIRDSAIGSGSASASGGSPAEAAAVRYAESKNVLLVAPAGDNGKAGDARNYPASYHGVVAVGAFGRTFDKAPYSSRQRYVTLTAAGEGVQAASRSGFFTMNSTCAASAIVAGIAALIRSEFPNLTATQVVAAMTHSTLYHPAGGHLDGSGYGTVDAFRALAGAATLSPPHARPAMQGARSRDRPVTPTVQGSGSVIMREISGDAEFSGLLLLILLVPIIFYGLAMRRRDRREVLAPAAGPSLEGPVTSGHGSMVADPLLEFFGPQHARPAVPAQGARNPAAFKFQPRPGLTGRSTMSTPLTGRSAFDSGTGASALPAAGPRGAGSGARALPGGHDETSDLPAAPPTGPGGPADPAGVGPVVRRAQVSGAPPWEPARQPTSDLPWAVVPPQPTAPRAISAEPRAIPPPPDSVWESAPAPRPRSDRPRASGPPPSLFEPSPAERRQGRPGRQAAAGAGAMPAPVPADAGPQPTSWKDLPGGEPQRPASRRRRSADRKAEGERGPIFVWTPMGTGSNDNKR